MKTKEEILKSLGIYPGFRSTYTYDGILEAMEQYANQTKKAGTDAVAFAEWMELEGYRIKGMDDGQRERIYFMFKNGLGGKDMQNDINYPAEL